MIREPDTRNHAVDIDARRESILAESYACAVIERRRLVEPVDGFKFHIPELQDAPKRHNFSQRIFDAAYDMNADSCRSSCERRISVGVRIAPDSRVYAAAGPHKKLEDISAERNDEVRRQLD